jgi:uncharacterized protein YcbK (DUF882 family)
MCEAIKKKKTLRAKKEQVTSKHIHTSCQSLDISVVLITQGD